MITPDDIKLGIQLNDLNNNQYDFYKINHLYNIGDKCIYNSKLYEYAPTEIKDTTGYVSIDEEIYISEKQININTSINKDPDKGNGWICLDDIK